MEPQPNFDTFTHKNTSNCYPLPSSTTPIEPDKGPKLARQDAAVFWANKVPRSTLIALLAALLLLIGCSSPSQTTATVDTEPTVEQETKEGQPEGSASPEALEQPEITEPVALPEPTVDPRPVPTAVTIPEPTPPYGPTGRPSDAIESHVLTATEAITRPVVYDKPNGQVVPVTYRYRDGAIADDYDWFKNPTYFGNALSLRVTQGKPGAQWAKVMIPTRPVTELWLETEGWEWSTSNHFIEINVAKNTVTVWDGEERIIDQVDAVTGASGRTTPVISTFVDEIMPGPNSAYGPWLLSLGVFSDDLNTFGGSLPKTALHGTNAPHLLGQYASNGCIRIHNDVVTELAGVVPVGTRVDIVDREDDPLIEEAEGSDSEEEAEESDRDGTLSEEEQKSKDKKPEEKTDG